jgi:hypothetical protein
MSPMRFRGSIVGPGTIWVAPLASKNVCVTYPFCRSPGFDHSRLPSTSPPSGCVGHVAETPPPSQSVRFGHVFIVVEENANYADVIANPSMPYLNSRANQYGLAANYFANAHPAIPNYSELTTGQTLTFIPATSIRPVLDE